MKDPELEPIQYRGFNLWFKVVRTHDGFYYTRFYSTCDQTRLVKKIRVFKRVQVEVPDNEFIMKSPVNFKGLDRSREENRELLDRVIERLIRIREIGDEHWI